MPLPAGGHEPGGVLDGGRWRSGQPAGHDRAAQVRIESTDHYLNRVRTEVRVVRERDIDLEPVHHDLRGRLWDRHLPAVPAGRCVEGGVQCGVGDDRC